MTSKMNIARLAPEFDFPPYTYVPGQTPHPVSDPAGHMYGEKPQPAELFVDDWPRCRAYLRGIDLFNYGYYWEAHEVWESLWHAAGRRGPVADFLKGLIKLAAAGVKALEGSPTGRSRHARRAAELFRAAANGLAQDRAQRPRRIMGLSLDRLVQWSEESAVDEPDHTSPDGRVELVFAFVLNPKSDTQAFRESKNRRDD